MGDCGHGRTGSIVQGDIERYAEDQPVLVFVLGFRRKEAGVAAKVLTLTGREKEAMLQTKQAFHSNPEKPMAPNNPNWTLELKGRTQVGRTAEGWPMPAGKKRTGSTRTPPRTGGRTIDMVKCIRMMEDHTV